MSVELSDGVVTLRPLTPEDRDAVHASVIESLAEISRWLPWAHPAYGPADSAAFINMTIQWWASQSEYPFGIFDAADRSHIGGIGINHIMRPNRSGCIGYWIRTSRTRGGLAARATRLVARFGFETLGLVRIEITAHPENFASRRVAEKVGARFEAIARNRIVMHGRTYPAALYSLVPEDLAGAPLSAPPPSSPEIL